MRIGIGYDVHRLVPGRQLTLGGVRIPHDTGLAGHSDADVLTHAICDAILGAAGLDDIGRHFPDSDPTYRNISSLVLLARTVEMVRDRGWNIMNIDATVLAEAPRLAPYTQDMRRCLADAAGMPPECVNIKATTTEGLGWAGREEGIGALATALLGATGTDD